MQVKRIILAKGAVETLEFFSAQMADRFEKKGMEVWFWDLNNSEKSRKEFLNFYREGETIFLTFNFIGLSEEVEFEWGKHHSVWQVLQIPCYCIMVDHPMYYFKQLNASHEQLTLLCIDRGHARFVEEYYPKYGRVYFLPLGGTKLPNPLIPYAKRKYDVVFAGNYVALPNLLKHLDGVEQENREFYFKIIKDLTEHTGLPVDEAVIRHLKNEFPGITRHEMLACMYGMIFIDLYVRSYFRREIVCSLAEAGIRVMVLGKDWELAECKRPENIIMAGQVDSKTCLEYMSDARISLNVMPWFKEGAHDRIFNSMLQGCLAVTDTSEYITEKLKDGEEYVSFSLENRNELPGKIKWILEHQEEAEEIAAKGYESAVREHQWGERADAFLKMIE